MFAATSCLNRKGIKFRKQDVIITLFHCCFSWVCRSLGQPWNSFEEFLHISAPDLVPLWFHKHYDTITKLPEHHLVSIDKHMPRHWNQMLGGNYRWCHVNKRVGRYVDVSPPPQLDVSSSLVFVCLSVCLWLVGHLLLYHWYTFKHPTPNSHTQTQEKEALLEGVD